MNETNDNHQSAGTQGELATMARTVFEYFDQRKKTEKREATWRTARRTFLIALTAAAFLGYAISMQSVVMGKPNTPRPTDASVALIPIDGEISSKGTASADKIVPLIDAACKSDKVKELALMIDSPGGAPLESERIYTALNYCKLPDGKRKPMVSVIQSLGASAAYMIAMHTDKIYAGKYAIVGSIGAVMRYVDASELAERLGLSEKIFRSGPLKGGPSMLSPTSPEDAKVNDEMVKELGATFLADVVKSRGSRLKVNPDELKSGRVWTSDQALAMGLIDGEAVLEDLKHTDFKGLKVVDYSPKPTIAKWLGAEDVLRDVISEVIQPKVQ
ncbi:MAG: S49 family peptidase [Sulfuricaulis sp.]